MENINWNKIKFYLERIYDKAYSHGQFKKLQQLGKSEFLIINPERKEELKKLSEFPCNNDCPMFDMDNLEHGACNSDRRNCSKYKRYKLAKDIIDNFNYE